MKRSVLRSKILKRIPGGAGSYSISPSKPYVKVEDHKLNSQNGHSEKQNLLEKERKKRRI